MTNKGTAYDTDENRPSPSRSFLAALRTVALVITAVGALGSLTLTILAGRSTPRFLLILFLLWVLSPFAGLAWANIRSKRWSVLTQVVLACVSLLIALASLAIYGKLISPPAGSPHAFVFVAFPPASWLLTAVLVFAAALSSRKRPH